MTQEEEIQYFLEQLKKLYPIGARVYVKSPRNAFGEVAGEPFAKDGRVYVPVQIGGNMADVHHSLLETEGRISLC